MFKKGYLLLLVLLIISNMYGQDNKKNKDNVFVKTESLQYAVIYDSTYYGGRIEPYNTIKQYSSVNGIVDRIYVKEGQRVINDTNICMITRKISSDNYRPSIIRAVSGGIVVNVKITNQMEVFDKTELFSIADDSRFKVVILASDKEIMNIKLNDACLTKENQIKGYVSNISIVPKENTGLFTVEITFNKTGELFIGKFVSLELKMNERKSLMVSQASIVKKYGKSFVFTIDNKKAKLREVKTGSNFNDDIEILSGIKENELYIVSPYPGLNDGDNVNLKQDKKL